MYEHAYHLDFGAHATAYIDAFMRNLNWAAVAERLAAVRADRSLPREDPSDQSLPSISIEELAAQLANGEPVQVLDARPRLRLPRRLQRHADAPRARARRALHPGRGVGVVRGGRRTGAAARRRMNGPHTTRETRAPRRHHHRGEIPCCWKRTSTKS
jgi:hypothetical protein